MSEMSMTASDPSVRDYIAFMAKGESYCVRIDIVREIRRWTSATMLPRSPESVSGVINLRGAIVPVIDFAARLGKGSTDPQERHSIVIVEVQDGLFGLLVDAVSDILTASESDLRPPPKSGEPSEDEIVESLMIADDRMICVVSVAAVVNGIGMPDRTPS